MSMQHAEAASGAREYVDRPSWGRSTLAGLCGMVAGPAMLGGLVHDTADFSIPHPLQLTCPSAR